MGPVVAVEVWLFMWIFTRFLMPKIIMTHMDKCVTFGRPFHEFLNVILMEILDGGDNRGLTVIPSITTMKFYSNT